MKTKKCDCGAKFYDKPCHRTCASREPSDAEISALMALFAGPGVSGPPTCAVSKPVLGFARSAL